MQRRDFIKSTCGLCAGAFGAALITSELTSCAPSLPLYKAASSPEGLQVPFSSFKADSKILVVRNSDLEFDILLVKKSDADVHALLMKCTHQNQPLTATNNGLFCAAHGSAFDLDGKVTKEPALQPLKTLKTIINDNIITIQLKS